MLRSAPVFRCLFPTMSSRSVLPLIPTLVVAALMIAMINLGLWQLRRYDEKVQIQQQYDQRAAEAPQALATLDKQALPLFQRVALQGHFQATPQWLIGNQIQHQRIGFFVLSVFVLDDGQRVMVNRGFVAGASDPNVQPDITVAEIPLTISGHLYHPSQPWRSPPVLPPQAGVNVLPVLDWALLRDSLGEEHIFPLLVRMDADAPQGYAREWQIIASIPEKHRAYAVQWFAMTFALLALYGLFLIKRYKTLNSTATELNESAS